MNARLRHVLTRLSLVSTVAVASLGAAACSRAPTPADTRPAPTEQVSTTAGAEHAPGYRIFRRIDGLDLRPEQRASMAEIERYVAADLAPHRETVHAIMATLADGIESGKLDDAAIAAHEEELSLVITAARATLTQAMNDVHDTLDPHQRAALVMKLRAEHAEHAEQRDAQAQAHGHGPLASFAAQLALTDQQKQALHSAVRKNMEEMFPGQRARREEHEARAKAIGDAFVRDDFDANDFDLGAGAEDAIAYFSEASARAVEISGSVLNDGQRQVLANLIRARATQH